MNTHRHEEEPLGVTVSIELVVVGLSLLTGYTLVCVIWPYASCRRCDGSGKSLSPSGKAFRDCRRCRGSGRRVRLGRWLWDAVSGTAVRDRRGPP